MKLTRCLQKLITTFQDLGFLHFSSCFNFLRMNISIEREVEKIQGTPVSSARIKPIVYFFMTFTY